ncbi:MAG: hypothetical protein ED557_13675 [Balneola sp.]|nr:MAG: hypothetical protein ED557_13675 [Balneola sp.]
MRFIDLNWITKKELLVGIFILLAINIYSISKNKSYKTILNSIPINSYYQDDNGLKEFKLNKTLVNAGHGDIHLYIFFKSTGCIECIQNEVNLLNDNLEINHSFFTVFLIGNDSTLLERLYEAEFGYKLLQSNTTIVNEDLNFDNPIAFLVTSTGKVLDTHYSEIDKPNKSIVFYRRNFRLIKFLSN